MKIAHVVNFFPPHKGGIASSVYNFTNQLTKYDHQITVFTTARADEKTASELDSLLLNPKVEVVHLKPWLTYGSGAFLPQLFWRLKGFDIIHLHYPFYGAMDIVVLKKFFNPWTKLILHYHTDSVSWGLKKLIFSFYKFFFLPVLLRFADAVICASLDYFKHSDGRHYNAHHPQKFIQIPFGVDLDQFVIYHDQKRANDLQKVVLFVGGLEKRHYFKGVKNLIQAFVQVSQALPDAVLHIVGRGKQENYYRQLARELGLANKIIFRNDATDSELVDEYNYCDLFVLPSVNRSEAFGIVLLEAMACAKPIIASNLPGVRNIFQNNKQGWLVKPGNIDELAQRIISLLKDQPLAQKMGQAGHELVAKEYTWEKAAEKLNNTYYRVKYSPKKKSNNHE